MTLSPVEAAKLAEMFISMLEREMVCTRRVLAAMPEAQLEFKLGDKGRTARELMWHLAASEVWFASGIVEGEFSMTEGEPPAPESAAAIVDWYDQNVPAMMKKLRALSGEHLAKKAPFFGMPEMPLVMYMEFAKVHSVHHRAQLATYLRALNAHVPDIYGGSADEPYQVPASA